MLGLPTELFPKPRLARAVDEAWRGSAKINLTVHTGAQAARAQPPRGRRHILPKSHKLPRYSERRFVKQIFPTLKNAYLMSSLFLKRGFLPEVIFDLWVWAFWSNFIFGPTVLKSMMEQNCGREAGSI